jgi:hypothetical protein
MMIRGRLVEEIVQDQEYLHDNLDNPFELFHD